MIRNATDLSWAPSDGDAVGAAAVLVGVTGTSLVVGPLGRRKLVGAAAMVGGLNMITFYDIDLSLKCNCICHHLFTRTLAKLIQLFQ